MGNQSGRASSSNDRFVNKAFKSPNDIKSIREFDPINEGICYFNIKIFNKQ